MAEPRPLVRCVSEFCDSIGTDTQQRRGCFTVPMTAEDLWLDVAVTSSSSVAKESATEYGQ